MLIKAAAQDSTTSNRKMRFKQHTKSHCSIVTIKPFVGCDSSYYKSLRTSVPVDLNGIIGVWTDSSNDASTIADLMLDSLKHRGHLSRVASIDGPKSAACLLGCLSHEGTTQEFAQTRTTLVTLNGSFYGTQAETGAGHVLSRVNRQRPQRALRELIREVGGFVGLVGRGDGLYAFRDVNGLKPLYFMQSPHFTAFASERKALWRVGLNNPAPVPPGAMVRLSRGGVTTNQVARFSRPREKRMTFEQAASTVNRLLSRSIRRIMSRAGKVCVAFSGGLDSALAAALAKRVSGEVEAISVGLAGSPEIATVENLADQLGIKITLEIFPSDSVEEYVRRLLWLIEEPNMMKLSVAIPLHWAAMVAARRGCNIMLCGQGSDELYGGYNKYAATLRLGGRRALSDQLYASVTEASTVNYERDDQATSTFPVEIRTPFADPDLIRFSLTIPSGFKVKDGDDVTRKWVLRDVAREVGLPDEIVWRRKKAIQHGTGVEKAILKIAKSRGLKPEEYLLKIFREVRMAESMP